ncbi:MAG: response regulator [Rhodobacteraceae bacterium]|nr:response regulator [Alphaproteobacteria bacterium]NNK66251.1 response regulator [Paracoccaceae bacterium]
MTERASDSAILTAIMEAAVDAIVVSDETGTILRANPAAARLFDFPEDALVGRSVSEIMLEPLGQERGLFMAGHVRTDEEKIIGVRRKTIGRRQTGEEFPLQISVGEATIDDAAIFVAILHDLTDLIAGEAALVRSQRLDAISLMTGGISHDFNNLLTIIIGNLELLELQCDDERLQELSREALQAAATASELTSRLMQFARQGHLNPVETDLRDVCRKTLKMLGQTLGEGYRVRTEFAEDVSMVRVDPIQLESALVNLVLNARDAMPNGGDLLFSIADISIDDTYMAQETDVVRGHYVRLMVSDNGEGMSDEAQKMAFVPFYSTKAGKHGTGLGLSMVYGFVRQSGGHITLYSEVGHGTSFGLYFPALQDGQELWPEDAAEDRPQVSAAASGRTILVVEDNEKVRKITVERLHALGYQTLVAESGDAAYQMLKAGAKVDLVFSDVVMPGDLNGYDLAEKVAEEFPAIRILLTSGYASDVVTRRLSRGAKYDILHKPYHQRDLEERLQALLGDALP